MNEMIKLNQDQEYELMKKQAAALYQSGFFTDLTSHAQALTKIMIGKEVGLAPFASISGIHLIGKEGQPKKPILSSNSMATLIANHPRYSYRVKKCDKDICIISFYESKDKSINEDSYLGDCVYTIEDAQVAGLLGKTNWKQNPSDMLFARCISRGAKRYTPGIFGGSPVYTPEELGVDVDEDGVVLQGTIEENKVAHKSVTAQFVDRAGGAIDISDEAIIEEIKETHVINTEFR